MCALFILENFSITAVYRKKTHSAGTATATTREANEPHRGPSPAFNECIEKTLHNQFKPYRQGEAADKSEWAQGRGEPKTFKSS